MSKLRTLNRRSQTGAQPDIFQGRGGFVELEYFDKKIVKYTKKDPAGKYFIVFFLDTLKTTFSN